MVSKNVEDIYPLSPMQLGMMFHSVNNPGSPVYLEQIRLSLDGLDERVFRQSWERMFERFPPLRTSVVGTGRPEPVQVVRRATDLPWQTHDCRTQTPEVQAAWVESFLQDDLALGFDLGAPSLNRLALVRTGERQYEFVWTLHHIVLDGWSGSIVLKDLLHCYDALVAGTEPALPERRPFRDYIVWLRDQDLSRAETYWRERLAGFRVPTRIEADRSAGAGEHEITRYARAERTLCPDTTRALRETAANCRVTLNTLTSAAWSLLLGRYTGEDDVVFGSVVSGRPDGLAGVDGMAGMFVNTLPFRTSIPSEQPIGAWLADVQTQHVAQREYQHSPLWEVQQWSDVPPGTPLFETLFVFENYPSAQTDGARASGLRARVTPPFDRTAYPLMLLIMPGASMRLSATYDAERYNAATVGRMLGHLERVLEEIPANLDRPASALSLIDETERDLVVVQWNRTERAFPSGRCLHQLAEAQAARTPDAPAVTHGDERLSYRELDERANRLAHELRAIGVAPDTPVGICVERSIDTVVGVLGILKAGGAYVPLDPAYPTERLAYMLESAAASVVVVHAATAEHVAQLAEPGATHRLVDLDRDAATIAARPAHAPAGPPDPSHLAYVLFTSGSTGRPKGVAMPHAPLVNLMDWQLEESAVAAGQRTLQFAPFSFDVSCQEIFATLAAGGELCLVDEDWRRDSEALLRFLVDHGIDRIFLPFVALQHLAETAAHRDLWPTTLREVITAGEQLQVTPALVTFFGRLPHATLVNQYGPTECHVVSSFALTGSPQTWPALPPIGRPIANTRLYVLDRQGRPAPVGVPGELFIGGRAVARGYLGDPALTDTRFIPDPFDPSSSSRLYRTGDLVRARPDGDLEFLGRVDQQVKLRGFRVEPGEIEAVVTAHPDVVHAAAVVREDRPGDRRLVVYVTTEADATPAPGALRAFALARLPDHMVPAAFVPMASLPLTPTGKIDRLALLAPEHAPLETRTTYVAPRGPIEETLAELWSEVLGVTSPGVHDDFFELGGHSLMATQLVARIRDVLRTELPLRALFEHPTIAGLAGILARPAEVRYAVPPLTATAHGGRAPLSYAQQRLWFLDQIGTAAAYNMPWSFRLEGALDADALAGSLNAIVRRHELLRTRFPAVQGRPVQEILPALELPLARVDLTALPRAEREAETRRLHEIEALAPFDLERGPLLRATLVRLEDERHVLFLSIHHIVFDGWSIGVLNRELAAGYRALTSGAESVVPAPRVQYADFANWQRGWMAGALWESQLSYWREKLADVPNLELATDRPRPPVQTYHGASHTLTIPDELARGLRTLSRRRGVTLAMTLLAAFKVLLARASGQDDIAVGSPIANRTHRELEDLIGFFVNTLVQRTDLSGDPTFTELLGRVQATALAAYEHQDLPFERIVDELQPERDQSRNPLFQVVFAMLNTPRDPLELPGLKVGRFEGQSLATRFDLELHLTESPAGISGGFCYNRDLFDAETIARMGEHFMLLLEGLVAEPDARISTLPMLPAAERRRILEEWNDPSVTFPADRCLHELFETQAARTPDAVAVVFEDERLTYGALNERANRLAHLLRSRGVGPDVLVGLCLERSLDLVVGILGILKAGGGYLPLDLANPPERIAFILDDTKVPVLVTEHGQLDRLPAHDAAVVCLDGDQDELAGQSADDPVSGAGPEHLAYVIYTSGSTGKPKGVLVEHRTITRLFPATQPLYGFDADDVWPLFHSCAFDFSVWEMWGALLHGGRLVVVPYWVSRSPEDFYRLLSRERVTVLNQTPSAFRHLIDADALLGDEHPLVLRYVIFGGEALDLQSLRPWYDRHDDRSPLLVNMYGITETTVHVTARPLSRADLDEAPGSVIGRPIPDLQVYALDEHRTPVPIGVPGELYVGGAGVARGYLDRPELTSARFVPDPFRPEPESRLYRTGDVGRFLANGDLEYLGRNDEQVKIRGYRIELGEIEAAIDAHPWVRRSVVALRDEAGGGKRLVGYVLRDSDGAAEDESQVVGQWQSLYEDTYRHETDDPDPTFNIIGWNSSYTEQPIPADEMREWVDETVRRLRAGDPRRVLEIGCGTGLLLFRVAPHCTSYVGTDFSTVALDYVRHHLAEVDGLSSRVELRAGTADDFDGLEREQFDLVILNSVVQYFPNIRYLLNVLEGAVASVAAGGRVYIGDVRNLRLLEAYHASVQLHRAPDELSVDDLRQQVRQRVMQEEELVVDPEFFLALPHHLPRITHVEIEPKHGRARNELTKFRYEVTLHVETEPPTPAGPWIDWHEHRPTISELAAQLRDQPSRPLCLRGVANSRTLADVATTELLQNGYDGPTVRELRQEVERRVNGTGVDPGALCALDRELPVRTALSWQRSGPAGEFDVWLAPADDRTPAVFPAVPVEPRPWSAYANHPLQAKMTRQLAPKLRESLERTLPKYMVPAAFVMLETLPLTANGKVDRQALPEPEWYLSRRRGAYVAPRNPTEHTLASIWAELLGMEQVGIEDNFFDLGGHSLLATQVVSRVREACVVELELRQLFDAPTIGELAEVVAGLQWAHEGCVAVTGDREGGGL